MSGSFLVAYWFAPAPILAGWVAFVVPTTFALICHWLNQEGKHDPHEMWSLRVGTWALVIVWFASYLTGFFLARRRRRRAAKDTSEPSAS
jgi:heme/copper-type cytochrome/quinol oxidase subunit 2